MKSADLTNSFVYDGKTIYVEWFDATAIELLPHTPWQQVYAICDLDGKVPLVFNETGRLNLPGGKTEEGESIDDTIRRELVEETNCRIISWRPIGYQKLTEPDNPEPVYQLRVYAVIEKIGEFEHDPGGGVLGYRLFDLHEINDQIHYGNVGDRLIEIVSSFDSV